MVLLAVSSYKHCHYILYVSGEHNYEFNNTVDPWTMQGLEGHFCAVEIQVYDLSALKDATNHRWCITVVFTVEIISGPAQFQLILFKGQLHF